MNIRTNIHALNAHRNMKNVGVRQSRAAQRLSSGFRINSAADDAAGLAISEKMRAQIRGLDQAWRNTQDAISLIQTAEGGIATINDMVIRIRELVVQAANDTYVHDNANLSRSDRAMIQAEISQLLAEIDSVARRVQFNTMTLLDGTFAGPNPSGFSSHIGSSGILEPAGFDHTILLPPSQLLADGLVADLNVGLGIDPAQGIQPHNSPPTTYETIDLSMLTLGTATSGPGWNLSTGGVLQIMSSDAFRIVGGGAPAVFSITFYAGVGNADVIMDDANITAWNMPGFAHNVRLWLEGSNSISATGVPGITMAGTSSLEINGPGSLNVTATPGSGIFGGSLTLNSGTLTVSGGTNGITSNPLTVNGGSLTVTGGTNGITSPNLNINGGSVNSSTITTPPANVNITGDPSITTTGGNPLLWFYPLPQNITVIEGSITETLTANAHTSQPPPLQLSFAWVQDGVGNVGTDSNTLAIPTDLAPGPHTFTVTATGLNNVTLTHTFTVTVDPANGNGNNGNGNGDNNGQPTPAPGRGLWFQIGANANQGMTLYIQALDALALGLMDIYDNPIINVLEESGADISPLLDILDEALFIAIRQRAILGAAQNRLDFTAQSLAISSENLSDAESRIRNADMAREMMRFTMSNVLQQAAVSMLAQANQLPNTVLQLLGD
ncbi:MAG: carbohydrate-binding domain-containing protein [Defluviitaleaceae bacterium]|nr:carbohydrate-binding domain-containing protein [Defluviitaleaceae bacterium]